MYRSHYHLIEKPFQISPDPRFLWLGEKHREALAVLKYGVVNKQGFLLLTGEVGTGKTTLINALVNDLGDDTIVAVVPNPNLDTIEFFNIIANAFKIRKEFATKFDFLRMFSYYLNKFHEYNKNLLLIIDEAQQIPKHLLEEIRMLSNIERQNTKLINIFFVGQNEFNDLLLSENCRALRQRITLTYNMEPLTHDETKDYIHYRMQVAGAAQEVFTATATHQIYKYSQGIPRLINILCDRALLTGYVKGITIIKSSIIKECAKELTLPGEAKQATVQAVSQSSRKRSGRRVRPVFYSLLLLLIILSGSLLFLGSHMNNPSAIQNYRVKVLKKLGISSRGKLSQATRIQQPVLRQETNTSQQEQKGNGDDKKSPDNPKPRENASNSSLSSTTQAVEDTISLRDFKLVIPFTFDNNEIAPAYMAELDKLAKAMLNQPEIEVVVKGYTDTSGGLEYNMKLSEFRANVVKTYLVGKGISPIRIGAVGMGEENPVEHNTTSVGRQANRRVEIEVRNQGSGISR